MTRLLLALLFLIPQGTDAEQTLGVLHIKVMVVDGSRAVIPVPRHLLLISDNPASALPRRVLTSLEGTVDIRLVPGNYTVESDRPVAVDGKAYQWTEFVDVVAGGDAILELTADNAEVVPITDAAASVTSPSEADPAALLVRWQNSLVAIWTSTRHGSGFLIDSSGLIATNQRLVGAATSVEVQLSPSVKVAGTVIASDAMRGIALIRIHPSIAALAKTLPLECDATAEPLTVGQEIAALELPLGRPAGTSSGSVDSVLTGVVDTDLVPSASGVGGPAFAPNGRLIGLTTLVEERQGQRTTRSRVVRVGRICEVVASAAQASLDAPGPSATHLPVEPVRPFPPDAAAVGAPLRAGNQNLYRMSMSDFDITFITPVQLMAARARFEQADSSGRNTGSRISDAEDIAERLLTDFSNWSDYVAATPPVLLIRVTPKLVEGFWTKVARGAAMTQGMAIPPIKRLKPDFARMRALCGEVEVTPVHPFTLEHSVSDTDTLVEGLYAFEPGALTPACATVTLELYSEKDPRKADRLAIDPAVIQQIWRDLEPGVP